MKKIISIVSITLFSLTFFSYATWAKRKEEPLDRIVAVVNDDVITQSELKRSIKIAITQLNQTHVEKPSELVLKKEVLDQLINKKLQLQIAKQIGINVSEDDINRVVENVANKNNITVQSLYEHLNQEGMSVTEYRAELREQMAVQKLQQQEVGGHISVTPSEITTFMNSKLFKGYTKSADKVYKLEDILIPLSDSASLEEIKTAKNRANYIATELNNGKTYERIKKEEATQTLQLENNDLGWRKLVEIPSIFIKHVINMHPNEIAGPIKAPNGFHLIRLTALRSVAPKGEETPDRNKVEQMLMQRKFEENVQTWLSKVRGQAFISMINNKDDHHSNNLTDNG